MDIAIPVILATGILGAACSILKDNPKVVKFFNMGYEPINPSSLPGVICLKCGTHTLAGEKCCDEPIHVRTHNNI